MYHHNNYQYQRKREMSKMPVFKHVFHSVQPSDSSGYSFLIINQASDLPVVMSRDIF